jgi:hypothetical protein
MAVIAHLRGDLVYNAAATGAQIKQHFSRNAFVRLIAAMYTAHVAQSRSARADALVASQQTR